jgi:hypothetical protein
LKGRLTEAAVKLDLSENDIVRHALRAAVNAIEANDYKIELPLEMALAKGSIESGVTAPASPRSNTRRENATERSRPHSRVSDLCRPAVIASVWIVFRLW